MREVLFYFLAFCLLASGTAMTGQPQKPSVPLPEDYRGVVEYLASRTSDWSGGVLKLSVPRDDLKIIVRGQRLPTAFGFSGWVAMTKGDGGKDVLMGDLVLLQEEVNPVMTSLLENGLEVTALHNHFFWDEPRLFFMHIHGMGSAADLARRVKPGLELIGVARGADPGTAPDPVPQVAAGALDTAGLAKIIGHEGSLTGPVYKVTVGRDDIDLREMGARIGSRMGLNSWAAIYGSDESAVIAGDIAMLEAEVTPVLKALRTSGLDVVALHQHMIQVKPAIMFLHYWGQGPAAQLAKGFRAALDASAFAKGVK